MSESDQYRCSLCSKLQSRECETRVLTYQKKDGVTNEAIVLVCDGCDLLLSNMVNTLIDTLNRQAGQTILNTRWPE